MNKKLLLKFVFLLLSAFLSQTVQSQTYNMPVTGSSSVTTCSGTVYDNGGTGNYANNSNSTITIYPGIAGNKISITFTSFSNAAGAAGGDWIDIYNGTSTSATNILHLSANSAGFYFTQDETYTATNSSGAITIRFTTDGAGVDIGFSATISCIPQRPDLIIKSPTTSPTSFLPGGSSISVSSTIYNQGDDIASSSNLGYYLSTNTNFDVSDVYLGKSNGTSLGTSSGTLRTASLTIPSETTAGNYYILFVADDSNLVVESSETNNVNYSTITVGDPFIDLTINSPSTTFSNIPVGTDFPVSSTIYNQGTVSATSSNVGYYLSTNTVLDGSEVLLGYSSGSSLTAATSSYRGLKLTIPTATTPGNYNILVVADYSELVSEANETNNLSYFPITVAPPFTGIVVPYSGSNSVTACSGTVYDHAGTNNYFNNANGILTINPVTPDSKVTLNFTSFSSESSYDFLYIYDGTSTSDPLIGKYSGSSSSASPGLIKATNSSGALTLKFTSDANSTDSGIGFTATLSCFVPSLDLIINSPTTSPTTIVTGSTVSVSSNIYNQGTLSVPASNVGYYLSTNTTYDASDVYLGNTSVASLSPSTGATRNVSLTIPSSTAAGNYYILFVADYSNLVTESNETNNVNYSAITLVLPFVDLLITSPTSSVSTITTGIPFNVNSSIYNPGTVSATSSDVGYYLSNSTVLDGSEVFLGYTTASSISAGTSLYRNSTLTIPTTTTPGNYYILFVADYSGIVVESNEMNNVNYIQITVIPQVLVPISGSNSVTVCSGTIYDNGGTSNYSDNSNGILTLNPATAGSKISLNFNSFNLETAADNLYIYDGTSTSATLIGRYNGTSSPGIIYATNSSGALTLKFTSDGSSNYSGFTASIACFVPTIDLIVYSSSASPTTVVDGSTVTVNSTIFNIGTESSPSTDIGYYLSTNTTYDATDIYLGNSTGSSLALKTSSSRSSTVKIPSGTPVGSYYILYFVDYNDLVKESNETNNVYYTSFTVSVPTIDLVIQYPSNSTSIVAGSNMTLSSNIYNQGTVSSSTSNVGYYLSKNAIYDASDVFLGYSSGTSLAAYSNSAKSATVTIPSETIAGSYYILYIADYNNNETESNETNNVNYSNVNIIAPVIDLIIQSPTLSPTVIVAGTTISVGSNIYNQGTVSASSSNVGYYLSTNTTYDVSDVYLGESSGGTLAASTSAALSSKVTIPAETPIGTYYVLYVADYNSKETESNETNNVNYKSLTVSLPTVNFFIQTPTASPSSVDVGSNVTVGITIFNLGTVSSSSSNVGYYLSKNTTYEAADVFLGYSSGTSMAAYTNSALSATLTIPSETIPGSYYILYIADYNNNETETNETDNITTKSITITIPAPDLVIQTPTSSPSSVVAGSDISVSSSIYNQGTASASSSNIGYYLSTNTTYEASDVYLGNSPGAPLVASTGSSRTTSLTVPSGTTAGAYYVLYFADYSHLVTEGNEINNVNYTSLTVTLSPIDLIIQNPLTSPTSIVTGSNISVSANIYNQGTVSSPSSNVGYYLSTNTTYDASDVYLGNSSGTALSSSTGSSRTATLTIPSGTTGGSYYILYVADYTNLVTEGNENNNVNYTSLTITTPPIDLVIQTPSSSPSNIAAGSNVSVSSSIKNLGTSSAPSSNIGYYLSTNTTYDAADVYLGSSTGSTLAASTSSSRSSSVTIPSGTTLGTYYILFVADYSGVVTETNETNNVNYSTINIVTPTVDLYINWPSPPSNTYAGGSVYLDAIIYNQGSAAATSSNVGYYLSANSTFDASDVFLGYSSGGTLSAAASSYKYSSFTIPSGTAAGSYYVLYVADYDNKVTENNETNNVYYNSITITAPPIDLVIQTPTTSPTSVVAGSNVSVSASIYNQGTISATSSNVGYYLSTNTTYDASDVFLGNLSGSSLSASTSSVKSSSITIPSETTGGTYYVLYVADYNNSVTESDETNNVNYTSLTVLAATVDLVIQTPTTTPTSVVSGSNVSVGASIFNQGTISASSSNLGYYLSTNTTYDASDVYLGYSNVNSLSASSGLNMNTTVTIPSETIGGIYYVLFVADYYNDLTESDETNNVNYTTLEVIAPMPDLVITSPTISSTSVVAGADVSVSSNISNQGTAAATYSNVGYYLSDNTTLEGTDVYLGNSLNGSLSASASFLTTSSITIPSRTAAGNYYILFVADYSNLVTESIESNNVNYTSIIVTQLPDLTLTDVILSSSTYVIGATIPFSHYVNNAGLSDVGASKVKYYLSTDDIISAEDILLDSYSLAGINAGDSSLINVNLVLGSSINVGNYSLITIADEDNSIEESNELNNIVVKSLTVSLPNGIETEFEGNLNLYPNPTDGKFALEYFSLNDVVITIYNSLGLVVDTKSLVNSNGINKKEFDLSDQTSGVYNIKIESEGKPSQFLKVVIQ